MNDFTGNEVFEHIINLTALLESAKNGVFNDKREIKKQFRKIQRNVLEAERLCIDAHIEQMNCVCSEFTKPVWTLRNNILGYYYHFEKQCTNCGKNHYTTLDSWNERDFPVGYENSTKGYYNLHHF